MSSYILDLFPAIAAIIALAVYTKRTRWYCLALVVVAMAEEIVPYVDSSMALSICVACFLGILGHEALSRMPATSHYFHE